ncbi:phage portal protein [Enterovibrio calviensis]|uniref:phage portal protein n=1 Tax=Enterovibrio calviensis TaxID=91359 RepID=UPI000482D229|nr:phage portal protein [Enterovibrio calviensis]
MFLTKSTGRVDGLDSLQLHNMISGSGQAVNFDTAMQDPTIKACVRVISQTVSTLPLKLYKRTNTLIGKEWVEDSTSMMSDVLTRRPNKRQTTPEFIEQMAAQLVLFSEYYALINKSPNGKVTSLIPFNSPQQVSPVETTDGGIQYHCMTNEGKGLNLTQDSLLTIRDMSLNTFKAVDKIATSKSSIGLALAATTNAEAYYRQGSRSGGFLMIDKALSDNAMTRLSQQFNDHYGGGENAHKIAILEDGTKFAANPYSIKDAQVLEARNASIREIAAIFGVPVSLLGISDPNMKDIETINAFFYKSCLQSLISKIEARLNLMLPRDFAIRFDVSEYLKGDIKTQAEVIERLFTRGLISRNEARKRMNLQADTTDEVYVVGSNNLVFGAVDDFTNPAYNNNNNVGNSDVS